MNYLKNCMYNKIAAYFHEHNNATSEEIWDKGLYWIRKKMYNRQMGTEGARSNLDQSG